MLIDKPSGPTSFDVVARVRRALGIKQVGHTGTLDPFATGILVVLVGPATRLARFVEQEAKTYRGVARLGIATDTDDATGRPLSTIGATRPVARDAVQHALAQMIGPQQQRPPAYSAKKVDGTRAYALARRGGAPALKPVLITVHALELLRYEWPEVEFRCTVSAGTYVRAMARDLGERLGTGAHLTLLRREAIGSLTVERAIPLSALSADTPLLAPLDVLTGLPRIAVDAETERRIRHGRAAGLPRSDAERIAVTGPAGTLVAVGHCQDGWFRPDMVLADGAGE